MVVVLTVPIYLSFVPLSIINITILIYYFPSPVFFAVDKVTLVEMALFNYFNPLSVLFYFAVLLETDISKVNILRVMINDGFGNVGHE
jgi:hypothetical protein